MSGNPVQSTDEVLNSFTEITECLGLLEVLMRDHAKACKEVVTPRAVEFFADQIGRAYMELCEAMSDLKLAMDVEAHRNS